MEMLKDLDYITYHNKNCGKTKILYLPINVSIRQTGMEDAFIMGAKWALKNA
jgi:hypothetical protein